MATTCVLLEAPVQTYVDTIEVHLRQLPSGTRRALECIQGKRLRVVEAQGPDDRTWGYRVCINQPCAEALAYFKKVALLQTATLSRADVAYDYPASSPEHAASIAAYLR